MSPAGPGRAKARSSTTSSPPRRPLRSSLRREPPDRESTRPDPGGNPGDAKLRTRKDTSEIPSIADDDSINADDSNEGALRLTVGRPASRLDEVLGVGIELDLGNALSVSVGLEQEDLNSLTRDDTQYGQGGTRTWGQPGGRARGVTLQVEPRHPP